MKAGETEIVVVFQEKMIFVAKEYHKFCWIGNNEQVLKPKITGRHLMVSEFLCLCHGNMVDPDTGKPCHVIMKYGKNYDEYWT